VTVPASVHAEEPSGPVTALALVGIAALHAGSGGVELQPSTPINDA
ncbi:MAG: hypothetical protein JWM53_4880, partial [bacterium]|nr:hypothetical protein [bacterium]